MYCICAHLAALWWSLKKFSRSRSLAAQEVLAAPVAAHLAALKGIVAAPKNCIRAPVAAPRLALKKFSRSISLAAREVFAAQVAAHLAALKNCISAHFAALQ
jgi:hypothetical protein